MSSESVTTGPLTALHLRQMLRTRYPKEAYAMLFEVGDATGFQCGRHLDAVVMSLWPSRGLELTGCEIKVTRSDWKKELADPAKASSHIRYLDRFYLVAANDKIVHPGELPATWGLMIANGKGLKCVTEAPRLEPEPISRSMLAALLRRAQEVGPNEIATAKREALAEQDASLAALRHENTALKRLTDNSRLKVLATFEEAAGITLDTYGDGWHGTYGAKTAGKMLRVLMAGESALRLEQMKNIEKALRNTADGLAEALAEWKQAE